MRCGFIVGILAFILTGSAYSAVDVCCVTELVKGTSVVTHALPMSNSDCKVGQKTNEGETACAAKSDPQNLCPTFTDEERCGFCQRFWNGRDCLTEDPVEKAKKELEKAAEKTESE